jgi:hypothetical protein
VLISLLKNTVDWFVVRENEKTSWKIRIISRMNGAIFFANLKCHLVFLTNGRKNMFLVPSYVVTNLHCQSMAAKVWHTIQGKSERLGMGNS